MNFKVPRGTQDILPSETWKWQEVEKIINETCDVVSIQRNSYANF